MPDARDLALIIASKTPLVVVESHEEQHVLDLLTRVAIRQGMTLYTWTITDGLNRAGGFGYELSRDDPLKDPGAVLEHIKQARTRAIYALCDYHPFLAGSPERVRLIKDIALRYGQLGHTLVFISHQLTLPPEIRRYSARFNLRMPDSEEILAIVREEASKWAQQHGSKVKADGRALNALVRNLQGLSWSDARRLARAAIFDDGAITPSDLPAVNKAKFDLLDLEGAVHFELDTARFSEVGGLSHLKQWLMQRRGAFLEGRQPQGLEPPRGILLLGVQGAGKSLAAKAVAGLWELPLIRLDMGALYNKYVGETEKNLREALQMAELMSPCVLWMDEVEKGLAQSDSDDGVSRRLLGTLLTWMAERTHPVFLVATANDVSRLPPELMRKGRMDEIFFVDLPDESVRREIFDIHLRKRQLEPIQFDLNALAQVSEGFSGAEIEQAIVSAIYHSAHSEKPLGTEDILHALHATQPLSVVRCEDVEALRQWAAGRCVNAG